ncbi:MAG: DinB family protein [Planctomycetota bacterium]
MLEQPINTLRFLTDYCDGLLQDIAPEEFADPTDAGLNPPAWIVGHLAYAFDRHGTLVGLDPELAEWKDLFAKGSTLSDPTKYPPKDELVAALHKAIDRLADGVNAASDDTLTGPNEYLRSERLPTLGDFLTYSMTGHFASHLGQLSAWRRAKGRPPLF